VSSDQSAGGELLREAIASLSSPDLVESPFGALKFFDGLPLAGTVSTVYDALDLMRGIEVFLNAVPGASLVAIVGVSGRPGSLLPGSSDIPRQERTRSRCF
jgi:hypothetical protein